jgi:hypothetical protein
MPAYTVDEIIALAAGTNPHYEYLKAGWQIVKQIQADVGALTAGGTPGWAAAIDTRWSLTDTGAADAYEATPNPAPDPSDAISSGQWCFLKPANTNTGASTFDVGTTEGAVAIKKNGGTALAAGDIVAAKPAILYYTGTVWELVNPAAASADVSGPGSSTDNAITRFDGTGGKTLQNSGVIVDDDNMVGGAGATINDVTASRNLAATDQGDIINAAHASVAIVLTAPDSGLVKGWSTAVIRGDAAAVSFAAAGTATVNGVDGNSAIRAQYGMAFITLVDDSAGAFVYNLSGDLS